MTEIDRTENMTIGRYGVGGPLVGKSHDISPGGGGEELLTM